MTSAIGRGYFYAFYTIMETFNNNIEVFYFFGKAV